MYDRYRLLPTSSPPPAGDPGLQPKRVARWNWELNRQPFGSQAGSPCTDGALPARPPSVGHFTDGISSCQGGYIPLPS